VERRRRIDTISDPAFLAELTAVDNAELRSRRAMCTELDQELSYYRRLVHGRIDMVAFERRRRRGEEQRSLVDALPDILGDTPPPATGHATVLLRDVAPPDLPHPGRRRIDYLLGDDVLTRLETVEDETLDRFDVALREEEREVSQQRAVVHKTLDALGAELQRRYRLGLTSVDELLDR